MGAAVLVDAQGADSRSVGAAAVRLPGLARRLAEYSFPLVAEPLADLLTAPENHAATARIEALIHLAALACRGTEGPATGQLAEWLNGEILEDAVAGLEEPIEDVFVSNVVTWFGNVRLFEGRWRNNADYAQVCLDALYRERQLPWVAHALRAVTALLRVGEAVVERGGARRYSRTEGHTVEPVTVGVSTSGESEGHVSFTHDELAAIGVDPGDIEAFVFHAEQTEALREQCFGNTTLERRPLARFGGRTMVLLPTAIGSAMRRFVVEQAAAWDERGVFQSTLHRAQFGEILTLGRAAWEIEWTEIPHNAPDDSFLDFVGMFDDGGYVHVVFVPDDLEETAREGLNSVHGLEGTVENRLRDRAVRLAAEPDYRRGLTVLVHGGVGRGFAPAWADLPTDWHQLCLSAPDFMLLGNESEFTALRAWKLLRQVADLEAKGVVTINLRGFLNLAAFAYYRDFELVPVNMSLDPIFLDSDFVLPLRHRVRAALDRHAALAPDGKSWTSIQRETTGGFLGDTEEERPLFISPGHRVHREVLTCVETPERAWWVGCSEPPIGGAHHGLVFSILDAVRGWLLRLAPRVEERIYALPSGPVTFRLRFPDIESFDGGSTRSVERPSAPSVDVEDGEIVIDCTPGYLRSFLSGDNLGDRLMIAALLQGVCLIRGEAKMADSEVSEWTEAVAGSRDARFLELTPARTPQDLIYDSVALPPSRLLMPEDVGWSRLDLARRAGYGEAPGPIPAAEAREILDKAVDCVWARIRSRLASLSRESVIERSLLNFVAVQKEHRDWFRTAAAQLALYDNSDVLAVGNERAQRRDSAGLCCRVVAEMALCTSPYAAGSICTGADLDFLVAEVAMLLECAGRSDVVRYGLAAAPPAMHANGSFDFESSELEGVRAFAQEHGRRTLEEAAAEQRAGSEVQVGLEAGDARFGAAFAVEFGLNTDQYTDFVVGAATEAAGKGTAQLRLRRSQVVQRLRRVGVVDPEKVYRSFVLAPRERWDEAHPENALARDWYPWRYSRRLSILRRPLVQLSTEDDPVVVVMPSMLAGSLDFLGEAAFGRLPEELFDSVEMKACIGRAADRGGHDFNRRVAERFNALEWKTEQEVSLTRLGGGAELGDVDVLAWRADPGVVYAVECKSLRFDRTFGEFGERLGEYAAGTVDGKRTRLQRHLDRCSFLKANRDGLSRLTGIPVGRLRVRSALVTDRLGPMQFAGIAREALDLVADYGVLEEAMRGQ